MNLRNAKTRIIVAAVITCILLVVMFVLLDPSKRLAYERNQRRASHLEDIAEAITQYAVKNSGVLPEGIEVSSKCEEKSNRICRSGSRCEDGVDMSILTEDGEYILSIPRDPKVEDEEWSGYNIVQNDKGRMTLCAPLSELDVEISLTK